VDGRVSALEGAGEGCENGQSGDEAEADLVSVKMGGVWVWTFDESRLVMICLGSGF
jgi:hypothetical protein